MPITKAKIKQREKNENFLPLHTPLQVKKTNKGTGNQLLSAPFLQSQFAECRLYLSLQHMALHYDATDCSKQAFGSAPRYACGGGVVVCVGVLACVVDRVRCNFQAARLAG